MHSLNHFKTLQALYIEDDPIIRENIGLTIGYFFKKVLTASSYDEGMQNYIKNNIDVLFVDIEMAGKSGIDLVQTIRSKDKKIPIVMITAYSSQHYLMKLINLNIQHYLLKPITLEHLEKSLLKISDYLASEKKEHLLGDDVRYNSQDGIVNIKDNVIYLSSLEKKLMNFLIEHKNHYVSYEEIEDAVWNPSFMSQSALKSMVYNLRKKLQVDCIKTYAKEGYLLKCD
jgi:DNA-binding response OmpR family regulator